MSATFGIGPQITKVGEQRPYFNYGVTPGAGASDGVEVANIGLAPVAVSVYPTDVLNNPDGSSSFGLPGAKLTDVGSWISLPNGVSPVTVTVGARSSVSLPIKISVPFNAQPGDHVGGIIASLATFARNAQGDIVRFDQRVATRAFFRVSGLLTPRITIEDLHAAYHQNWSPLGKGSVTVSYTVHNRGNVKVAVSQSVDFSGLFGTRRVATAPASIPDLLPGGYARETVRITGVFPEILGTAHVHVVPSPVPGDSDPPLHPVSASALVWTLPFVLILILIAVGLYVWYRRRPKHEPATGGAELPSSASAEDKVAP